MKKLLFVFNPTSGRAQIKNNLLSIIDTFVKGGYLVTAYPTQKPLDAYNIIKKTGHRYSLIAVSGGDGTLNEGISGYMQCKNPPPLGYIPAGTTNDFATSIGISKNMTEAAKQIMEGKEFLYDIGKFGDSYFTYIAAFGAFTDVSYSTPQQTKNMLGHAAYILEGIKTIGNIKPYHIKVSCNGETVEDDFLFGMISNSKSIGGFKLNPSMAMELNDGKFEVVFIKNPPGPLEFQTMINDLLRQDMNSPYFCAFSAGNISIESDTPIAWTLDGEFGGEHTNVEITNIHNALNIIT